MNRCLAVCLSTLVLGVAAIAAAGCGSGDAAAPAFEPGAPAGDVREVNGVVTARRGDAATRPLAIGDEVSGDDVVETAAGASVVIELRHNGARWSLGAAQSRQVASSPAWKAPRGEGGAVGGDRSAAAGRLAEREGADTASTAVATERAAPGAAAPMAEATMAAPPADPAAAPGEARARLSGVTVTGALARVQVRGHVARHLGEVLACWAEQVGRGAATAAGTAELVLAVDGAGAVTSVDPRLDSATEPARACLVAAAQAWSFPSADRGTEIHASFALGVE